MFSAGEGVKGLEQCYKLEGFDPAKVTAQFSYDDLNNDGVPNKGEVRYNGEATNAAYACYEQISKLATGFNGVFAPKQAKLTVFDGNAESPVDTVSARLFSESPIINKNYASIRIDYSKDSVNRFSGKIRAFNRDGTLVNLEIKITDNITDSADFFRAIVNKLENPEQK